MAQFIPREKREDLMWMMLETRMEEDDTQKEVGEKCDVSPSVIHRIETDSRKCYEGTTLIKVCDYLGVDARAFLEANDE